jgi:hypothetical protein
MIASASCKCVSSRRPRRPPSRAYQTDKSSRSWCSEPSMTTCANPPRRAPPHRPTTSLRGHGPPTNPTQPAGAPCPHHARRRSPTRAPSATEAPRAVEGMFLRALLQRFLQVPPCTVSTSAFMRSMGVHVQGLWAQSVASWRRARIASKPCAAKACNGRFPAPLHPLPRWLPTPPQSSRQSQCAPIAVLTFHRFLLHFLFAILHVFLVRTVCATAGNLR